MSRKLGLRRSRAVCPLSRIQALLQSVSRPSTFGYLQNGIYINPADDDPRPDQESSDGGESSESEEE